MIIRSLLFITLGIFPGCITSEAQRNKLKIDTISNIEMDAPVDPTAADLNGVASKGSTVFVSLEDGVKVHTSPSKSAKILKTLSKWEEVTIISTKGEWSQTNNKGWIESRFLGE